MRRSSLIKSNGGIRSIARNSRRKLFAFENPKSSATSAGDFPPINFRRATTIRSQRLHNYGGSPMSRVKTEYKYRSLHPSSEQS